MGRHYLGVPQGRQLQRAGGAPGTIPDTYPPSPPSSLGFSLVLNPKPPTPTHRPDQVVSKWGARPEGIVLGVALSEGIGNLTAGIQKRMEF